MRLPASKLLTIIPVLIFYTASANVFGQSLQCDCDKPPGGSVTCEPGQVPICRIVNGEAKTMCKTPPRGATRHQLQAWLISIIEGREITVEELKASTRYEAILQSGRMQNDQMTATFLVPDNFKEMQEKPLPDTKAGKGYKLNFKIDFDSFGANFPIYNIQELPNNLQPFFRPGLNYSQRDKFNFGPSLATSPYYRRMNYQESQNLNSNIYPFSGTVKLTGPFVYSVDFFNRPFSERNYYFSYYDQPISARNLTANIFDDPQGKWIDPQSYPYQKRALMGFGFYVAMNLETEEDLQEKLKANPKDTDLLRSLAKKQYERKKYTEAEATIKNLFKLIEGNASDYGLLARVLLGIDKQSKAIDAFRMAVKLEPDRADLWAELGASLYNQQEYAEAEAAYRKALMLKPDNADLYYSLGSILYMRDKYTDAETAFRKATQLRPNSAKFFAGLGSVLIAQRKYEEAINAYKEAIRLDPTNISYQASLKEAMPKKTAK